MYGSRVGWGCIITFVETCAEGGGGGPERVALGGLQLQGAGDEAW